MLPSAELNCAGFDPAGQAGSESCEAILSNCRFADIVVGQSASLVCTITDNDLLLFANVSGDVNPTHLDASIDAGNMLAKQLIYLSGADAAGLLLGACVPIILTSRSDSMNIRLASVALAKIVHAARTKVGASP